MRESVANKPESAPESRAIFLDVARVYGGVLIAIIVFAVLASFVGLIAQMLYAIVAFLFFFIPQKLLERRDEPPEKYGLVWSPLGRNILWGLGATLVTLPFFLPGYLIWETYFLEREWSPDVQRYRQWSVELDGEPKQWGRDAAGVWVWSHRDVIEIGLRNNRQANNRVVVRADQPFKPRKRGAVNLKAVGEPNNDGEAAEWIATLTHSRSRGVVTIRGPDEIDLRVEPVVEGNERWPLYEGPGEDLVESGELSDDRGIWWLVLWLATQFVLVAFPEEYFYRGFIQTRLDEGFALRAEARGKELPSWLGFTPGIFWTSVLFGIGHLVVPVGGVLLGNRMAVFFPALIFGWLRLRTGSIVAPVIYHAFSNTMVLVAAVHFV